jgi:hypothetical protein
MGKVVFIEAAKNAVCSDCQSMCIVQMFELQKRKGGILVTFTSGGNDLRPSDRIPYRIRA